MKSTAVHVEIRLVVHARVVMPFTYRSGTVRGRSEPNANIPLEPVLQRAIGSPLYDPGIQLRIKKPRGDREFARSSGKIPQRCGHWPD